MKSFKLYTKETAPCCPFLSNATERTKDKLGGLSRLPSFPLDIGSSKIVKLYHGHDNSCESNTSKVMVHCHFLHRFVLNPPPPLL